MDSKRFHIKVPPLRFFWLFLCVFHLFPILSPHIPLFSHTLIRDAIGTESFISFLSHHLFGCHKDILLLLFIYLLCHHISIILRELDFLLETIKLWGIIRSNSSCYHNKIIHVVKRSYSLFADGFVNGQKNKIINAKSKSCESMKERKSC